jgi:hypothetical protein
MDEPIGNDDPALRLRYVFMIPEIMKTARVKRHLIVLIARTSLDTETSAGLANIQLARWNCDDVRDEIDLDIVLSVPINATVTRALFDRCDVGYADVAALDELDAKAVASMALQINADVVLGMNRDDLTQHLIDDVMLVVDSVEGVLHNVEIHLKGFDVPWSFEWPVKMQPWTNFYAMCEPSTFAALEAEWRASAAESSDAENKMRILFGHTLPAMCFSRDRMEFYRQQDRWTDRNEIERQDFRFEYTTALNNFYVTMYSAVDLVAALCVSIFGLNVPKDKVFAISGSFRKERKHVPGLDDVFDNEAFWEMYKLPRLIRHEAAHSGPVTPQQVYTGDDNFTNERLDEVAEANGLFEDLHVIEKRGPLPEAVRNELVTLARFKAKLMLLGRPIKHGVFLTEGNRGVLYNPDPASDLKRFLAFLGRVFVLIKPWGASRQSWSERPEPKPEA